MAIISRDYGRFKKLAKRLHVLLPEFVAQHPDGGRRCDAQELLARAYGYPNLHAYQKAVARNEEGRHAD